MSEILETLQLGIIDGFRVRLEILPDYTTKPWEAECYDLDDVASWKAGDWCCVTLRVVASRFGVDLGEDWLSGVEYGLKGDFSYARERCIDEHQMPSIAIEAAKQRVTLLSTPEIEGAS